jgi:hypothetical protein
LELPIRNEGVWGLGGRTAVVALVQGGGKGLRQNERVRFKVVFHLTLHTLTLLGGRNASRKIWSCCRVKSIT